jgi:hypothetical protein
MIPKLDHLRSLRAFHSQRCYCYLSSFVQHHDCFELFLCFQHGCQGSVEVMSVMQHRQ